MTRSSLSPPKAIVSRLPVPRTSAGYASLPGTGRRTVALLSLTPVGWFSCLVFHVVGLQTTCIVGSNPVANDIRFLQR